MLLAPNAREFQTIEWRYDHLYLNGWEGEKEIAFDRITDAVRLVPGLFWNRLVVALGQHSSLVLGGIDKHQSAQLEAAANGLLATHWARQFTTAAPAIIECAQRWHCLTSYAHYFRHSQLKVWLDNAERLLSFINHRQRAKYLDGPAERAADTIESALIQAETLRETHNAQYVERQMDKYKVYLDRVENKPLSAPQRRACVQHDDSNLVLAGAGTGKTSTMVGKAGYLIESGEARPDEILMLAFGKKAASEMDERVASRLGIRSLKIKTFHSLGLEIIGIAEGKKPSLSDLAEDEVKFETFIGSTVNELKRGQSFRSTFIYYFLYCLLPIKSLFDFKSLQEYIAYCKQNEPRTLKGELVKSYEELAIANFLFRMGVQYQYESAYKIDTATTQYRQYTPDFYLPQSDLYIEHFAIGTNGMPPPFMDQQKYLEGVKWKRALHWQYGTRLLETYSHEQADGVLLTNLEEKLKAAGVKFDPLPEEKLLDAINSIPEADEFTRLLAGLLKAFKLARWNMAEFVERAKCHLKQADNSLLIKLFQPVYERYQAYLEKTGSIDFEDMINRAIEHIFDGTFRSPYRFILVDEFQDISGPRADLIKGLLKQSPENSLFCVGDDWQAIYRFTGSDVSFTKKFDEHFGSAAVNALDTTYRFNDKIGGVASRFVQSNPDQIKKTINSLRAVQKAAVTLVPSHVLDDGLTTALSQIVREAEPGASVLLLARFKFKLPGNLRQLKHDFPRLKLHCMSVHASKGKEADYVVVLGMDSGKFGFPSEKATPPLLDMLLPTKEGFAFAEERRLFYVALTRARHHVYLLGNPQNCSVFIRELRTYGHEVEQLRSDRPDVPDWSNDIACPSCKTGYLICGGGRYSRHFSCSNRPYCEHTEQVCRECGGIMRRSGYELVCQNKACGKRLPLCPECGGTLQERKGAWGVFWGCSNYRGDDPGSCRYTTRGVGQSFSRRRDQRRQ